MAAKHNTYSTLALAKQTLFVAFFDWNFVSTKIYRYKKKGNSNRVIEHMPAGMQQQLSSLDQDVDYSAADHPDFGQLELGPYDASVFNNHSPGVPLVISLTQVPACKVKDYQQPLY